MSTGKRLQHMPLLGWARPGGSEGKKRPMTRGNVNNYIALLSKSYGPSNDSKDNRHSRSSTGLSLLYTVPFG
jgi:hypothetical protein